MTLIWIIPEGSFWDIIVQSVANCVTKFLFSFAKDYAKQLVAGKVNNKEE
jgi:hypothetical protein